MTGFEIYELAMLLLGYTDTKAVPFPDKATEKRAIVAINQILLDLGSRKLIKRLSDTATEDAKVMEILPYGVAMLIALIEGDAHQNVVFTAIYNAKRTAVKSKIVKIRDIMQRAEETP